MAFKTGERMRWCRLCLGYKQSVLLACLSLATPAYGGSKPFAFYKEEDNLKYFCSEDRYIRYARTTQIGIIHLGIIDFEYGRGDARTLGVSIDRSKGANNTQIYNSFLESIKKHNSGLSLALEIGERHRAKSVECLKLNREVTLESMERCDAEATAFIAAKYGNAIGQFYCNIRIKGTEYPILTYSTCSVNADSKMEFNRRTELTDINAFEPSTIEDGLIRLLDEHVRNLSDVFVLAAKCD